jgi:lysozyme
MINQAGVELIKGYEGYADALPDGRCRSYWDKHGGVWTIGWGSTGPDITKGVIWSREQAEERLRDDIDRHALGVLRASPKLILYPNRFAACTSFAYNLGVGRYQSSTLRRLVNLEEWDDAAEQFQRWVYAGGQKLTGLVRRRAAEAKLFSTLDSRPLPVQGR